MLTLIVLFIETNDVRLKFSESCSEHLTARLGEFILGGSFLAGLFTLF